jgi:hypothetical protein
MTDSQSREQRVLEGVAIWASYYRANPDKFAADYLHLDLHVFQKILLVMMNIVNTFVMIGARGIGKSFLSAVFLCIRAILYPGSKLIIASGTRGQSINVLEKIQLELVQRSPELYNEIDWKSTKINGTNAIMGFKNGSYIKVVTASDTARGNRATLLLLDEFRMVSKDVIDTILRKFLTQRRMPLYTELTKKERIREYEKEKNKIFYLSSAYFTDHWAYTKCTDTCRFMLDDKRSAFVCGLPYQLSIREGLLDPDTVIEEMSETDFNEIKFAMEYESKFWGDADGTFFNYAAISKNRKIKYPMLPDKLASLLHGNLKFRIPPRQYGELRILSADIALMSSTKHNNDASAIFINQLIPTKSGRYSSNIVYCDCAEGLHTEDQALMIRRLYDEFECDYIVLDTNGVGLGVYDALVREMSDPDSGDIYPPLSCCNDPAMAERCTAQGADKVIWSIKASSAVNSECAVLLREGFRTGKIRLLINEFDAEALLNDIKEYKKLSEQERLSIQMPYIHTTLLINELVKLQHEENGNKIKIKERSGMRKDRYSSLSYNYYVATQLEAKLMRRNSQSGSIDDMFIFRAPKAKHRR